MKFKSMILTFALYPAAALIAQQTVPFTIVGRIQSFKLVAGCAQTDALCDAFMKVNGITIHIPRNTVMIFPATYLTPNDTFKFQANVHPKAIPTDALQPFSGLALEDPAPFTPLAAFEAEIVGNSLPASGATPTEYVAGLVRISQQALNTSDGYILAIDTKGELTIGPEGAAITDPSVTRVRINDPFLAGTTSGRYSAGGSFDERFTADQQNATIKSATGYPMCIPRSASDPRCPSINRPTCTPGVLTDPSCPASTLPSVPRTRFTMGPIDAMTRLPATALGGPGIFPAPPCTGCDPHEQTPFQVGDRITFSGTLAKDATGIYVSAHTITAWVAIYTEPGKDPAYLSIEKSIVGTSGIPFTGIFQETGPGKVVPGATGTTRLRIEAVVTDPSRSVNVFALDLTGGPADPVERSLSLPGTAKLRPAPRPRVAPSGFATMPASAKPPFGRVRLNVDRALFLPPTRELRVRFAGNAATVASKLFANGVSSGEYDAPTGEFLFPENLVFGQRPVPANFENVCFVSKGTGPLTTLGRGTGAIPPGPPVPPLVPFPSSGHSSPEVPCP